MDRCEDRCQGGWTHNWTSIQIKHYVDGEKKRENYIIDDPPPNGRADGPKDGPKDGRRMEEG